MRNNENFVILEGYLYDLSELEIKTVKKKDSKNFGKEFLGGKFSLALVNDPNNIIDIHVSYAAPTYNNGNVNATYNLLLEAKNKGQTWIAAGKDGAAKVSVTGTIDLNDFYSTKNEDFVAARRIECRYVNPRTNFSSDPLKINHFETDMVITNIAQIEENEERHIPEHVDIRGAVFKYGGEILPMTFTVSNPAGMEYFLGLDTPVYTKIGGSIKNNRIETTKVIESAFGGPREVSDTRSFTTWDVDWAAAEPYEFDDEETITAEELKKAQQDREIKLAEIKTNAIAYAEKAKADLPFGDDPKPTGGPAKGVPKGSFNF